MEDVRQNGFNDALISAVRSGFSELIKKQDENAKMIRQAVEGLGPQPAPNDMKSADAKTAFWTSYMKLADEHDKELQQKYSTDLDTGLIFAGLFSAVSSAFIIQFQPQLQSSPTIIIIAVQSLLYISLFATLLVALLAVLGKQWVMHYQAAGSRGTIEERGLERQRKLDGLRRWRFDAVLQMFPLLLQLALLLFSSALSLYLWNVHRAIGAMVLGLTLSGVCAYTLLLLSAIISSDSPFQTPLALVAIQLGSRIRRAFFPTVMMRRYRWRFRVWVTPIMRFLRPALERISRAGRNLRGSLTRFAKSREHTLPSFVSQALSSISTRPQVYPESYFDPPSPAVPAVLWALETTTDPRMIDVAA
ncbi:hypothetical protein B0H16DRAFT_1756777 [Mycena metata]|uniref:DUF6535 domain-containing protein n=1 Tax=Mycena metata TaxID=1033252 RepID=A0AAD7K213_9AGAR|nr:hypothetical protein B0H16DRAFT_1756777 [Mycena metata]